MEALKAEKQLTGVFETCQLWRQQSTKEYEVTQFRVSKNWYYSLKNYQVVKMTSGAYLPPCRYSHIWRLFATNYEFNDYDFWTTFAENLFSVSRFCASSKWPCLRRASCRRRTSREKSWPRTWGTSKTSLTETSVTGTSTGTTWMASSTWCTRSATWSPRTGMATRRWKKERCAGDRLARGTTTS